MLRFLSSACLLAVLGLPALAQPLGIGRLATPAEITAWNIDIRPDGQGLPIGQGSVLEGEEIYIQSCAACHGDFGEGVGRWPALAGGNGTLGDDRPVKTIGSYWPYLSTVWDYIHRAMPFGNAASLSDDDTYALVAYLMFINDVVTDEGFILSKDNFATLRLENEGGFRADDRLLTEFPIFNDSCMENCKSSVEITARPPK